MLLYLVFTLFLSEAFSAQVLFTQCECSTAAFNSIGSNPFNLVLGKNEDTNDAFSCPDLLQEQGLAVNFDGSSSGFLRSTLKDISPFVSKWSLLIKVSELPSQTSTISILSLGFNNTELLTIKASSTTDKFTFNLRVEGSSSNFLQRTKNKVGNQRSEFNVFVGVNSGRMFLCMDATNCVIKAFTVKYIHLDSNQIFLNLFKPEQGTSFQGIIKTISLDQQTEAITTTEEVVSALNSIDASLKSFFIGPGNSANVDVSVFGFIKHEKMTIDVMDAFEVFESSFDLTFSIVNSNAETEEVFSTLDSSNDFFDFNGFLTMNPRSSQIPSLTVSLGVDDVFFCKRSIKIVFQDFSLVAPHFAQIASISPIQILDLIQTQTRSLTTTSAKVPSNSQVSLIHVPDQIQLSRTCFNEASGFRVVNQEIQLCLVAGELFHSGDFEIVEFLITTSNQRKEILRIIIRGNNILVLPASPKFVVKEDENFVLTAAFKKEFGTNIITDSADFEIIFQNSPSANATLENGKQLIKFAPNVFTTNPFDNSRYDGLRDAIPIVPECDEMFANGCPIHLDYHLFDQKNNFTSEKSRVLFFVLAVNDGHPEIIATENLIFEDVASNVFEFSSNNEEFLIRSDEGNDVFPVGLSLSGPQMVLQNIDACPEEFCFEIKIGDCEVNVGDQFCRLISMKTYPSIAEEMIKSMEVLIKSNKTEDRTFTLVVDDLQGVKATKVFFIDARTRSDDTGASSLGGIVAGIAIGFVVLGAGAFYYNRNFTEHEKHGEEKFDIGKLELIDVVGDRPEMRNVI